jgi:hypothetical protein
MHKYSRINKYFSKETVWILVSGRISKKYKRSVFMAGSVKMNTTYKRKAIHVCLSIKRSERCGKVNFQLLT